VTIFEAARIVLAPSAVGSLLADKPLRGSIECRIITRDASGSQTLHDMKDGVREVDAPKRRERTVGSLLLPEEEYASIDGIIDFLSQRIEAHSAHCAEGAKRRACTFDV